MKKLILNLTAILFGTSCLFAATDAVSESAPNSSSNLEGDFINYHYSTNKQQLDPFITMNSEEVREVKNLEKAIENLTFEEIQLPSASTISNDLGVTERVQSTFFQHQSIISAVTNTPDGLKLGEQEEFIPYETASSNNLNNEGSDFQEKIRIAQEALRIAKENSCRANDLENYGQWINNTVDKQHFLLAKMNAMVAQLNEVTKIAGTNAEKCLKYTEQKKRIGFDSEFIDRLSELPDLKQALEEACVADSQLDEVVIAASDNVSSAAHNAQSCWEEVMTLAESYCAHFLDYGNLLQDKIRKIEATNQYYKSHKKEFLNTSSTDSNNAQHAFNEVIDAVHQILEQLLGRKQNALSSAREAFNSAEASMQESKKSFEEADHHALTCLEDTRIHFFQEEQERLQFFNETNNIWAKRLEVAQESYNKYIESSNHISTEEIASKLAEIESLKKAVEAVKSIQEAEKSLTKATRMEFMPNDISPKNTWAHDALSETFITKRGKAIKIVERAKKLTGNVTDALDKVKEHYFALDDSFLKSSEAENRMSELVAEAQAIEKAWNNAKKAAGENKKNWNEAKDATQAAQDAKITWARNVLRLAGRCTGDFSLGFATKQDGELLGKLWLGKVDPSNKDKEGFLVSYNGLKRLRPLSYKPNYKKYQMNFERRSDINKKWQTNEEDGSRSWGNGHLTIINPHDEVQENSMSLKFLKLTPSKIQEAFSEKEARMQMEAEALLNQSQKEQETILDMRRKAKAASYKKHLAEKDRLDKEATLLEKNLAEKLWPQVIKTYKNSRDTATSDLQKKWWNDYLEIIDVQSKMIDSDGNEELWSKAVEASKVSYGIFDQEIEQHHKAHHLIPESEIELKLFWNQEIENLLYAKSLLRAKELYYNASKESCIVDENAKNAMMTTNEQDWNIVITSNAETIALWDHVTNEFKQCLTKGRKKDERRELIEAIQAVQDAKNQRITYGFSYQSWKATCIANEAYKPVLSNPECEQLWDDVIEKAEQERTLLEMETAEIKKARDQVPGSRKDLLEEWKRVERGMLDRKNQCIIKEFIYKGNKSAIIANRACLTTQTEELLDRAIQKSEETKLLFEHAVKMLENACVETSELEFNWYQENFEHIQQHKNQWTHVVLQLQEEKTRRNASTNSQVNEASHRERARQRIKEMQNQRKKK
ncbi:MAG TPA: hypothetical protein VJK54_06860 [Chthoniobacterales bacterium]|nr:hypothetical protein [Chthoniobacterales bacterium]